MKVDGVNPSTVGDNNSLQGITQELLPRTTISECLESELIKHFVGLVLLL